MLFSASGVRAATPDDPSAEAFLHALIGNWEGRAVRTPRGPLPYDVRFERTPEGEVAGIANPGAALHHWAFFVKQGRLRLRFLTTFRGNTEPTWLTAEKIAHGTVQFRADHPPYLTVHVAPKTDRVDIHVFLRDQPHVEILLTRRQGSR